MTFIQKLNSVNLCGHPPGGIVSHKQQCISSSLFKPSQSRKHLFNFPISLFVYLERERERKDEIRGSLLTSLGTLQDRCLIRKHRKLMRELSLEAIIQ